MTQPGHSSRRRIIQDITLHIRRAYPRQVLNDDIAQALGLESVQVRKAVKNFMATYPQGGITEVAPYVYVATESAADHGATAQAAVAARVSTSAVPLVRATATRPTGTVMEFRFVAEDASGTVILQDQNRDLWRASRL